MATKKSAPKKSSSKKSVAKKITAKKKKQKEKPAAKKTTPPKAPASASPNCKCLKKLSKYYCYHLVNGGWERKAATGFPTKAMCEENCCG